MKNEEISYFSDIGKKLNIKYGNVIIEYKKDPKLIRTFLRQQLENCLFYGEDKNKTRLNRNIFDSFMKKKSKLNLENDKSYESYLDDEDKKKPINKYKYHQLHLEKIKRLKTSNFYDEKPRELIYEPNFDSIKRKIITGPKWNTLTGRKKQKNLIVNNSFNACSQKLNVLKKKQKEVFKKLKIIPLKKNYSALNITQNLNKIAQKMNLTNKQIKCEKFEKYNELKKSTPKQEKTLMNSFPKLYTPRTYILHETDIKNKYLKNIFLINTTSNKTAQRKPIKTYTKIYRKKQIGLNHEQIKLINALKNEKLNIKEKIKKLKIKKAIKKKYKLILTDNKKENKDTKYEFKGNKTGIRLIKKSFNYFINKKELKKNNETESKISNKSFYLSHPLLKKNNEFYKFNIDDVDEYSFSKFDKITFKANNCN